jgi:predicted nucleotidyltransferase
MNILNEKITWKIGSFNIECQKKIQEELEKKLRCVTRIIIKTIPNVISIYLTDSFAYGEGSVICDKGKIEFLSDIDLVIISKNSLIELLIKGYYLNNYLSTSYSKYWNNYKRYIDFKIINLCALSKLSAISLFKIKTGKCIYGIDMLRHIKYIPSISSDIYTWDEMLTTFFDRMFDVVCNLISNLTSSFNLNIKMSYTQMLSVSKFISVARDLLLLSLGVYIATKEDRQQYLREHWDSPKFYYIRKSLPNFLELSEKAHHFLLKPSQDSEEVHLAFKALHLGTRILFLPTIRERYSFFLHRNVTLKWKLCILTNLIQELFEYQINFKESSIKASKSNKKQKGIKKLLILCQRYRSPPMPFRIWDLVSKYLNRASFLHGY